MIPEHNCKNCGECCGPVPINVREYIEISEYVNENKPMYNKNADALTCKFRVNNQCSIYEVRPILCRLMGVCKGMSCKYGNTFMIDGTKYINFNIPIKGMLNDSIETNY